MKIQLNSFEFMEISIENSLKKKQVHCWKEKTMKIIREKIQMQTKQRTQYQKINDLTVQHYTHCLANLNWLYCCCQRLIL